ncbi:MAG: porin family protein [Bacteroidales bacterium]
MKKIISLAILITLITDAQAQFFMLGVRGGVSSSTVRVPDVINIPSGSSYSLECYDPLVGFHAGLLSRITIKKIYVQPELLFSTTGGKVKVSDITNGGFTLREQKFNRIDIPVLAGVKTGPLRLEAGPVASFILSENSDLFGISGYKEDFKKATIGFQAGIGFDIFKKLAFDLKYEGSLSNLGTGLTVGSTTYPYDTRNSQWIVSLGFFF